MSAGLLMRENFFEGCVRCGDQDHRSRLAFGSSGLMLQRGNAANPFRHQVAIYLEPRSWSKTPRWWETTRVERESRPAGVEARSTARFVEPCGSGQQRGVSEEGHSSERSSREASGVMSVFGSTRRTFGSRTGASKMR